MTALVWFSEFGNCQTRNQTHDGIGCKSSAPSAARGQRLRTLRRKPFGRFVQYGLGRFVPLAGLLCFAVAQPRIRELEIFTGLGQLILLLLATLAINRGLDFVVE